MASIDRADPVIMGHILAQHRELHAQMLAVKACLAAVGPWDAARAAAARESLVALRDHLRSHFAREEQGGFLEESIARMPRLAAPTRRVMAEHPALLAELGGLIETLEAGDSATVRGRLAAGCEQFMQHLLEHERSENAIVQEGYNEDLGLD